jgi:hypothetical protein
MIIMSISQATNLAPQPADASTGLEGSLADAPQFWQKTTPSDNCAPQFLQNGNIVVFSFKLGFDEIFLCLVIYSISFWCPHKYNFLMVTSKTY